MVVTFCFSMWDVFGIPLLPTPARRRRQHPHLLVPIRISLRGRNNGSRILTGLKLEIARPKNIETFRFDTCAARFQDLKGILIGLLPAKYKSAVDILIIVQLCMLNHFFFCNCFSVFLQLFQQQFVAFLCKKCI